MKKKKSKPLTHGRARARRPKSGKNKGFLVTMSEEEKQELEKAAAKTGVSMSRFVVERALTAAYNVLNKK